MASGGQRDDRVAEERFLADDETRQLVLERLGQLGHPGCVDARFFGDHDPPRRDLLGGMRFAELREILADEVALTSGDEALLGRIVGGLLVGLAPAFACPPCPLASRSVCAASPWRAASRPLIAAATAWSVFSCSCSESSWLATSLRAWAAEAASPLCSEDDALLRESRIWLFCACCDAFANALASSSRSLGERLCSWEARSRTDWAPWAGLLLIAWAALRPAEVPLRAFARFCALLCSAGVPGSASFCSCCSAGVTDSSAFLGLSASRIFAWASWRIFWICASFGDGFPLSAIFFLASATALAARAWLTRSAWRWASTWSMGLGSSASASAKIARIATSVASPRLTRTGKAPGRLARAAGCTAPCRAASSTGPDSAR